MRVLTTLKTFTIVAAFLAGGTALAIAQNGPATGGERPVAGGANGGGHAYGDVYRYALVCLLSFPPLPILALLTDRGRS
jgi:hypothetical protein